MLDQEVLSSIAQQMMSGTFVELGGERLPVKRTSANRFRTVAFEIDGRKYQAIEQNPEKPSRWGQLASKGHQVVQFKDAESNKFVAVSVDGKVRVYGQTHQGADKKGDKGAASR
jgi:hypothetical protein